MDERGTLGDIGEKLAARRLQEEGYRIVDRNFRCKQGEIDIVAQRDGQVVFCEVKTRRSDRWGLPCEAVDHRKQARLRALAATWLRGRPAIDATIRFDVISIVLRDGRPDIAHLVDAF